ncbi:MAG: GspH/FimT family pseudopilin [Candidatus Edwardsbacteria bacterium]|nr:GspH/FimT family pseudopilin [Candidatus Edwardsbacteria bacterium]
MNRKGFTLIELMVVILIIGIAAGFSVPNLIGSLPLARLNNSADDLKGQLMVAKSKAISGGVPYIAIFTQNGTSFQVVKDLNSNETVDSGEPTVSIAFTRDITSDSIPAGNPSVIIFSPRGDASTSGGVRLTNTRNAKIRIHVVPSGSIIKQK